MRIALAQLNPVVGDVASNLRMVLEAIEHSAQQGAQVVVTSEMVLLGYPPRDLLFREGVVEACERAVTEIAAASGDICVLVGHPRRCLHGTRHLRNSVSICHEGEVKAVYDKQLLPGYDVFDEDRYFEPGAQSLVIHVAGVKCGIAVCEDLWRAGDVKADLRYPITPAFDIAQQGAELILSVNASPFVIGKWRRHVEQLSEIAQHTQTTIVAVNQVGANDDQVYDGRSVVVSSCGMLTHVLEGFQPEIRVVDTNERSSVARAAEQSKRWESWQRETFHALRLGIADYVRKTGHHTLLLGLSGGIDSALAATLAVAAVGSEHVHGVMMPSVYSSAGSIRDSQELARRLRIESLHESSIADLHNAMRRVLQGNLGIAPEGVTDENIQARLRGMLLMAVANAKRALVLATSNKSEMAVGYSTLYGDMCGALAPLGDLTKTRIYELATWINTNHSECGFSEPPIPDSTINKPPSAELRPNQTDQDTLPPYDMLDEIIERRIELEQALPTIVRETGYTESSVQRVLRMIDRAQFKRDQAPVVLKVTGRAFGPGRPMPIVMAEHLSSESRPGNEDNLTIDGAANAQIAPCADDACAGSLGLQARTQARPRR